jgi:molecular chaperone DnaJ
MMANKRDYYEVLGLTRGASADEIRAAYRRLAKEYHPDINKSEGAEERFKEINEAYAILSDDQKRASYDRFGHSGVNGIPPDFNFDFGGFGDIFEQFFGATMGGGRRRQHAPRRGTDLRYDMNLEFEEAVFGVEREIEFNRLEICDTCQGSGAEPGTTPVRCTNCDGSGEVRQVRQTFLGSMVNVTSCPSCRGRGETITSPCRTCSGRGLERNTVRKVVEVPAGVDEGTQIRLSGEGEPGANGGPKGNLYVVIHVKPHRYFRRRESDVIVDLEINIAQAALGAKVSVPTVDGDADLTIPAGTQTGKVIRMRGKGIPHLRRNGRGDQKVIITVAIPRSLKPEQRELFEQLAETLGTEVLPQDRSFLDRFKDLLGGLAD